MIKFFLLPYYIHDKEITHLFGCLVFENRHSLYEHRRKHFRCV